jgi:hypothetical protein
MPTLHRSLIATWLLVLLAPDQGIAQDSGAVALERCFVARQAAAPLVAFAPVPQYLVLSSPDSLTGRRPSARVVVQDHSRTYNLEVTSDELILTASGIDTFNRIALRFSGDTAVGRGTYRDFSGRVTDHLILAARLPCRSVPPAI